MSVERFTADLVRVIMTRAKNTDDGPGTFIGHAAVFNTRAAIGDPASWGFWEEIDSGAFSRSLAEKQDVRFLVDHDPSRLLARTSSGTLDLSTDRKGLVTEAGLPDTTLGRDTRVMIDRGDLSQMSFGFIPTAVEWSLLDDNTELLRILDLDLFDVSVVTFPAYEETDATVRSRVEALRRSNPLARRRHDDAKARFEKLRPPDGPTRIERNA
jgi:hypothetical protein